MGELVTHDGADPSKVAGHVILRVEERLLQHACVRVSLRTRRLKSADTQNS